MAERQRFQIIEFEVGASGDVVSLGTSNELDKLYEQVEGISLDISDKEVALIKSKIALKVGNIDVTDENFLAGKLYGNMNVPQNERFFKPNFELAAKGNRVEGKYIDGGNASAYPYTAYLTFWLKGYKTE